MNIYKVYVYTEGYPHVSEMIVAASSELDARERAVRHVKQSNPTKGRALEESQNLSKVISSKETGLNGCLVVNKLPVSVCREMGLNL